MARFYFPVLFWVASAREEVALGPFRLVPRRWEVTSFDLYSMAAEAHPLRVPGELMMGFLRQVNAEIAIDAADYPAASRLLDTFRAMSYILGMAPNIAPFATSHSLNDYAGINARSSDSQRARLPEELRAGITAQDTKVEGWPNELSLMCIRGQSHALSDALDQQTFIGAAEAAVTWEQIEVTRPTARTLRTALAKAPLMPDMPSSILHMWQALENIFGIDREVTYRVAMMLAELCSPLQPRASTYATAKKSYGDRSKIAHGSAASTTDEQWMRAWELLRTSAGAVLHRCDIPTANALTDELLSR